LTVFIETLYVPLLGRIYASKNHPDILYDKMALSIADEIFGSNEQVKYPRQSRGLEILEPLKAAFVVYYFILFFQTFPICPSALPFLISIHLTHLCA
jgi:O-methyltransferase involved in polyketide biosynthesis